MARLPATLGSQGGRLAARRGGNSLEQMRREFDNLFGRMLGGWLTPFDQEFETLRVWDFDVKEEGNDIVVRAEMPGFNDNEIAVQLNDNILTVRAEKEKKGEGREEAVSFFRSVVLPPGIDAEKVQATYRNGVLELHIPRAAGAQPKQIKVQGQQEATGQQGQQALPSTTGAASGQGRTQGQQARSMGSTASGESKK